VLCTPFEFTAHNQKGPNQQYCM